MPHAALDARSRTWSVLTLAFALVWALSSPRVAGTAAPAPAGFSNASLQGSYALVGIGDSHIAASIGVVTFDGTGKATGSLTLNGPAPDRGRKIVRISSAWAYTVNADGTGTATVIETFPDGTTFTGHHDFVITQAAAGSAGGVKLALDLFSILREPGVAAQLVTFGLRRLPD
jgi:hypothetical protein